MRPAVLPPFEADYVRLTGIYHEETHVQDRLSSARLSTQEGRKRAAAADEAPPLPEMPGAVRKRLVGRARVPEMQDIACLARRRQRRHGVVEHGGEAPVTGMKDVSLSATGVNQLFS